MTASPAPMDEATLEALKGSIQKWEGIVAGTTKDEGEENCPLCKRFNNADLRVPSDCIGCPVFERTGRKYCADTPYVDYADLLDDDSEDEEWLAQALIEKAQAELDFLKSLLPVTP